MKSIKMLLMAAFTIVSFSLFAQAPAKENKQAPKTEYSCPMQCEGNKTYDKPGTCPKCGMNLKAKAPKAISYVCPMHAGVTSDKPGNCSQCGMALKAKEAMAAVYSCPMQCEGEKTYDKPGSCPKCGMNLKTKKTS